MTPDLMTPARGDIEAALASEEPLEALTAEARRLLAAGWDRAAILALLEDVRGALQVAARGADEDIVLQVMDALTGWTGPGAKI